MSALPACRSMLSEETPVRIAPERLRPSPALIQSTRRRFYRLRSSIFRTIWPADC
jgi:hypothetical protein